MSTQTTHIKPTYFEIFTKVLNELNWREVSGFNEIEKTEHKRVLNLINVTNAEVLSSYIWDFQIEKAEITLGKDETTILSDFGGKIISIWEGSKKYKYIHPTMLTPVSDRRCDVYSNIGSLIITTPSAHKRNLSVIFASDMYAQDKDGVKKAKMENADDTSIIPMPYLEPILVYGTLIRTKANPSFAKFGYWRTLYYNAVGNLRTSGAKSNEDSPRLILG